MIIKLTYRGERSDDKPNSIYLDTSSSTSSNICMDTNTTCIVYDSKKRS